MERLFCFMGSNHTVFPFKCAYSRVIVIGVEQNQNHHRIE
jgi:hypothetical protein